MIKRQWPPVLFLIAFAISLVHASIPHTHPELSEDEHLHEHHHEPGSTGAHEHLPLPSHDHDDTKQSKPVFSHFSNGDYVGNAYFHFTAKANHVIDLVAAESVSLCIPVSFEKSAHFHKARDLPSGKHRSITSLRAPPSLC